MQHWILPVLATLLGVVVLLLALALLTSRRSAREALAAAHSETDELRDRVAGIEARLAAPPPSVTPDPTPYVITDLGEQVDDPAGVPAVPSRIDGRLFADIVLRESVVKGASLVHGVRRALEPENRFRMRYTFRREVKRARKQRRAEERAARRLLGRRRAAQEDVA